MKPTLYQLLWERFKKYKEEHEQITERPLGWDGFSLDHSKGEKERSSDSPN